MSASRQRLYDLLPTYIRFRDQQQRDAELEIAPLEALVNTLELPLQALEENMDALYRGWFIETCDLWKVPYLADLLGIHGLAAAGSMIPSQRRRVANAIAYRRRKGTPAALSRAAEDATGWPCKVTELRHRLAISQSLACPHPDRGTTADLRAEAGIDELGEISDRFFHAVDIRRSRSLASGESGSRGLGLHGLDFVFWRLDSYPVSGATASPAGTPAAYRLHPAGVDTVLFNSPQTPVGTPYRSRARHLPVPLRRRNLAREVAALRQGDADLEGVLGAQPAFRIRVSRQHRGQASGQSVWQLMAPDKMAICDLSDWRNPRPTPDWRWAEVAVDPETGRLLFAEADPERRVRVDYSYGSSFDLGGGPYPRDDRPDDFRQAGWRAIVDSDQPSGIAEGALRFDSLADALAAWRAAEPTTTGHAVIRIDDNGHHPLGEELLELASNRRVTFRARERCWPHVSADLTVRGPSGSRLELDGVGFGGRLMLQGDPSLKLHHCTLYPPRGAAAIEHFEDEGPCRGEVEIDHSIVVGCIRLPPGLSGFTLVDSVIDGGGGEAIGGRGDHRPPASPSKAAVDGGGHLPTGPAAHIERSTIFGLVSLLQLRYVANTLFTGVLSTARTRQGEAYNCYFVNGSTTPRRHQCLEGPRTEAGGWLRPAFTSTTYGQPGYAQLGPCSGAILTGGEQGNEIGVFHRLSQGDRLANLQTVLDEHLPAGFTSRISFAT